MNYEDFDEDYVPRKSSKQDRESKPPKPYDHLTWDQYKRCTLRENIVLYANQMHPLKFMAWLEEHRDEIKRAGYTERVMQEMRRVVDHSTVTLEHMYLVNDIFGPYLKPCPTPSNTVVVEIPKPERKPLTVDDMIDYITNCTYEHMYNWMHGDEARGFVSKMNDSQLETFRNRLFDACMRSSGLPKQRMFEDGDEEEFERLICEYRGVEA